MDLRERIREKITFQELARDLDIHPSAITGWFKPDRKIPAERVNRISELTGIPREELRPDIFTDLPA